MDTVFFDPRRQPRIPPPNWQDSSAHGGKIVIPAWIRDKFAYLLLVRLYFPCIATTVAVYREAGSRWALFLIPWTTGLAYAAATLFYQASDPWQPEAAVWIGGVLALLAVSITRLRYLGSRRGG